MEKFQIKKLEWGNVTLHNDSVHSDIIIDAYEVTKWDWKTTNFKHNPGYTLINIEKILKYYNVPLNSLVIFSTGIDSKIKPGVSNGNYLFMPSKKAIKYYNNEIKKNNSVILFLHTTC